MTVNLMHGDCLELMKSIPDNTVDLILCDLPYGTTACKWDTVIPFEPLWEQYKRILSADGTVILFGAQPFTTELICSNRDWFKYCYIWKKTVPGGFLHAKNMPLRVYEDLCVFSPASIGHKGKIKHRMTYNPQGLISVDKEYRRPQIYDSEHGFKRPSHKTHRHISAEGYPSNVLEFGSVHNPPHPTQKPVDLLEYLIRTHTDEGGLVLDNCMGSGSTGVACVNTGRSFIGIELEDKYFEIAKQRISEVQTSGDQVNESTVSLADTVLSD